MSRAYIDTTVLTNALLKDDDPKEEALESLDKVEKSLLPEYAIREFRCGPLHYWAYTYRKLSANTLPGALIGLSNLAYQKNRQSTSLEALAYAMKERWDVKLSEIDGEYNEKKLNEYSKDSLMLSIKSRIIKAWKKRNKIVDERVDELPCHTESPPNVSDGEIRIPDRKCDPDGECCLAEDIRSSKDDLKSLLSAVKNSACKNENAKRAKVLKEIIRKNARINEKKCRYLGDAIFALFCPDGAFILTTNIDDHEPLANAVGKDARTPTEVVEDDED